MRTVTTTLFLLLCVLPCSAQANPCPKGNPTIVRQGAPAPCDGVAMATDDALTLAGFEAKHRKAEAQKQALAAQLRAAEAKVAAERDRCDERVGACDAQVSTLSERLAAAGRVDVPWHQTPAFVATVTTVVVGGVVAVITYFAVRSQ